MDGAPKLHVIAFDFDALSTDAFFAWRVLRVAGNNWRSERNIITVIESKRNYLTRALFR